MVTYLFRMIMLQSKKNLVVDTTCSSRWLITDSTVWNTGETGDMNLSYKGSTLD